MRAFVNSIPKSGTNLLEKLVRSLGVQRSGRAIAFSSLEGPFSPLRRALRGAYIGTAVPVGLECSVDARLGWLRGYVSSVPDGCYLSGHAPFSPALRQILRDNEVRPIHICRDPRAVLVSWAGYSVSADLAWYPFRPFLGSMDLEDRIEFFLTGGDLPGGRHYRSFRDIWSLTEGWLGGRDALCVRYEDLVGRKGGGSDKAQAEVVEKVARFLGFDLPGEKCRDIAGGLYGNTHTFRIGTVDSWRNRISERLAERIMAQSDGPLLRQMGYGEKGNA